MLATIALAFGLGQALAQNARGAAGLRREAQPVHWLRSDRPRLPQAQQPGAAMLTISQLSKTYKGGVRALDAVSLSLGPGMFGLLGPNGAGKSTLMRTIATLQEPDAGSIDFNGIDVLGQKTELRKQLGYLPQEFGAYPRTTPTAMLEHFAVLKGYHGRERKALVEQLLVRTNLWEARKRNVDSFSGGMRQRFGIAQALIGDPKLQIVDEPTAGIDPYNKLIDRAPDDNLRQL